MIIDTHCHLNLPDFNEDRGEVITNAKKAGITHIIVPGVDAVSSRNALMLAKQYKGYIYASIGIHPYDANKSIDIEEIVNLMDIHVNTDSQSIVAIGECGLDYHLYGNEKAEGKKTNQQLLFSQQCHLATTYNLPVIIHCRNAFSDLFKTLDSLPSFPRGVIHCFSGGALDMSMALERNLYLGIDGNCTYSKQIQSIIPYIPLENLLIETDAPYLTPSPHRGQRNEPKHVRLIAKTIAQLKGISIEEILEQTSVNAFKLFHLANQ